MQTANATAEYATIYYAINTYLLNDHLFLNFVYFVDLNETNHQYEFENCLLFEFEQIVHKNV